MSDRQAIFMSAGDPSADYPGKLLIDEIRRKCPAIEVSGLGGKLMQQAGLVPLADHRQLAVLGFWEVLPKYSFFRNLMKQAVSVIEAQRPKAVILIDYPGFNLRLARKIKHLKIPMIYFISPQVWAWGKGRIKAIKELIDLMLVIFPFEVDFFGRHDIPARFVGHPIVDRFAYMPGRETCRELFGASAGDRLIALLPGSRVQEVKRMLPVMTQAVQLIEKQLERCRFLVGGIENVGEEFYRQQFGFKNIEIVMDQTPTLINASDFVITSSGTATVEVAYFTRPMVVIYKTGLLTYQIARRLVSLDSVGMVNIVAGRRIVPELLQREATPGRIASQVLQIMHDRDRHDTMVRELSAVREKLGQGGTGASAFEAIMERVKLC